MGILNGNCFDLITLKIINQIAAEIENHPENIRDAEMGQTITLRFLYIGGTRYPAHAFRLRVYITEEARTADAERDEGIGLLVASKAPQFVLFAPNVPIAGDRYDHDNDPVTPPILRTVRATFKIPDAEAFIPPDETDPKPRIWYGKTSILQKDAGNPVPTEGVAGGMYLPIAQFIYCGIEFDKPTRGDATVYFLPIVNSMGIVEQTGYEWRMGVYEHLGGEETQESTSSSQPENREPISLGEWLDLATTPEPVSAPPPPPEQRRLFGVFDSSTLEQAYEGSHPLIDHRRQKRLMEIAIRMVNDDGINTGYVKFSYPLRAVYSSAPVFIQQVPTPSHTRTIKLIWEAPNLLAFPIILFYQYRWAYAPGHNFGKWINNGKQRELTITMPPNVQDGDIIFVQIRVVTKSDRTLTHNEFAGGEVAQDYGEIAEFKAEFNVMGGSLLPPGEIGFVPIPEERLGEEDTSPTFAGQRIDRIIADVNEAIKPVTLPEATGGNGVLTYNIPHLPNGFAFDPTTRILTGTPTVEQGSLTYIYEVRDEDNDIDKLTFSIQVLDRAEDIEEALDAAAKARILSEIKNKNNWSQIGNTRTWTYKDGGTATVRNRRGSAGVTFMNVPTLKSPLFKSVVEVFINEIFIAGLKALHSSDQTLS